ncbi:MAG TPA: hypothetical protein DEP07_24625 [Brevibacillus sp.]|nr:hypothetical protein [Brevibacillus sp.]
MQACAPTPKLPIPARTVFFLKIQKNQYRRAARFKICCTQGLECFLGPAAASIMQRELPSFFAIKSQKINITQKIEI